MDREQFCRQSRVLVVAGKGGVGKTTVTAALARMAADAGLDVLVVGLDDAGALPMLFGVDVTFGYDEVLLYTGAAGASDGSGGGRVQGRVITPDDALLEYLMDHGLRRVAKRLVSTGVLDVVSTAIPGIREILVLGKVKQLERAATPDLLLLDAPATGHAVRFLTSANGLMDAARGGPLRTQAAEVVEMLHDPERLQVLLVTLPEETPVNELVETAFRLEDEVGVMLGPVVVNACYPPVAGVGSLWIADPETLALVAGESPMEAEGVGDAVQAGEVGAAGDAGPAGEVGAAGDAGPAGEARTAGHARKAGDVGDVDNVGEAGALRAAAAFRASREAVQAEQIDRLSADMPLPQLRLPYLFSDDIGPEQVASLADAFGRAVDELDADELAAATSATVGRSDRLGTSGIPDGEDGAPDEAVSS
jgi:anion-transporting  ArsA/GET3 family ATPase